MSLLMSLQVADHPTTEFKTGEVIVKEASPGAKVFVLKSGSVKISINGKDLAETDKPGDIFGEIATIKGCNYGATVTATSDSEFFVIDNFITYLKQNPDDSISILKMFCERILSMNKNVSDTE